MDFINKLDHFDGQYNLDFDQQVLFKYACRYIDFKSEVIFKRSSWDSDFFNKECYRLLYARENADLTKHLKDKDFIMVRTNTSNTEFLRMLTNNRFSIVNSKLYLRKLIEKKDTVNEKISDIKNAKVDVKALKDIAVKSFTTGRFFKDANVKRSQAADIYKNWIETHLGNEKKDLFFISKDDKCAGFVAGSYLKPFDDMDFAAGFVDLITVHKEYRSSGYAAELLKYFEDKLLSKGINILYANTSIDNYSAQGFFFKNGFRSYNSVYELHWWK